MRPLAIPSLDLHTVYDLRVAPDCAGLGRIFVERPVGDGQAGGYVFENHSHVAAVRGSVQDAASAGMAALARVGVATLFRVDVADLICAGVTGESAGMVEG